jgi:hypothetical protein
MFGGRYDGPVLFAQVGKVYIRIYVSVLTILQSHLPTDHDRDPAITASNHTILS